VLVVAGLVVGWTAVANLRQAHELVWAVEDAPVPSHLGFGGWWFAYVARPLYIAFGIGWVWRIVLLTVLFRKIAGLELALVPTHPDARGGLGFLGRFPKAFQPVVFAASAVLASGWAHQALYHGVPAQSLRAPMITFVVLVSLLVLAPLLVFVPPLLAAKRRALLEYGRLVGRHGRLVRRRWILGETVVDDGLLAAPELGPVADTVSLYQAVERMGVAPIGRAALMAVVVPAVIPMLAVVSIEIPLKDLLLTVLKALG
jgi:hypothetical protein